MKAIVMHHYGGPDVLRYEDVPVPAPGPGEVLLRIAGTSFNPGDAVCGQATPARTRSVSP